MSTKEKKISLRDKGPFTPAEAAHRIEVLSRELPRFKLTHPKVQEDWLNWGWETTYPVPLKQLPPQFLYKGLTCVAGDSECELHKTLLEDFKKISDRMDGCIGLSLDIQFAPEDDASVEGVQSLNYSEYDGEGELSITSCLWAKPPAEKKAEETEIPKLVSWAKGLSWDSCFVESEGKSDAKSRKYYRVHFSFDLAGAKPAFLAKVWGLVLATQKPGPKPVEWTIDFEADEHQKNCASNAEFFSRIETINKAGLPGNECRLSITFTFDGLASVPAVFDFAVKIDGSPSPLACFDSDKGIQALLQFSVDNGGIRFHTVAGVQGYENFVEGEPAIPKAKKKPAASKPKPPGAVEKVRLTETGPFTPAEAARRIKVLSQQLPNFRLRQPSPYQWWYGWTWETDYPVAVKKLSPHIDFKKLFYISGAFTGKADQKLMAGFLKSAASVPESNGAKLSIEYFGRSVRKEGLCTVEFYTSKDSCFVSLTYRMFAKSSGDENRDKQEVPDLVSEAAGQPWTNRSVLFEGWRKPDAEGCVMALVFFTIKLPVARRAEVEAVWHHFTSRHATPKKLEWQIYFNAEDCRDAAHFVKRVESINQAGLPGTRCSLATELTFAGLDGLEDIFELALNSNAFQAELATFETANGKTAGLQFTPDKKGIRFIPRYH